MRLPVGRTQVSHSRSASAHLRRLWEFAEYFAFIRDSPELATASTDTLGDLALGLTGSAVAALATASLWSRLR